MKKSTRDKYIERLNELIQEGLSIAQKEVYKSGVGHYFERTIKNEITSWQVRVNNAIRLIFKQESEHYNYLTNNIDEYIGNSRDVRLIVGLLEGSVKDLEDGFIEGLEFIISGDVFDSIIQEAKYLTENNYKDPGAVLARVVLEDSLKKLAKKNGIASNQKSSRLNDELKSVGAYPKAQWRLIQAKLDIGNAAAHGNFDQYKKDDVIRMLEDIERFMAQYYMAE